MNLESLLGFFDASKHDGTLYLTCLKCGGMIVPTISAMYQHWEQH